MESSNEPKSISLKLRVSATMHEDIKAAAKEQRRTISDLLRLLVTDGLNKS